MNGSYDKFVRTVSLTVDKWSCQLSASFGSVTYEAFVGADPSGTCRTALGEEEKEDAASRSVNSLDLAAGRAPRMR